MNMLRLLSQHHQEYSIMNMMMLRLLCQQKEPSVAVLYEYEYEYEYEGTAGHLLSVLVGPWQCRRMQ